MSEWRHCLCLRTLLARLPASFESPINDTKHANVGRIQTSKLEHNGTEPPCG